MVVTIEPWSRANASPDSLPLMFLKLHNFENTAVCFSEWARWMCFLKSLVRMKERYKGSRLQMFDEEDVYIDIANLYNRNGR